MGADIGGTDAAKSEPNVVPLCDILLVLLIIFMVVTPMIQKGANVKLPEAEFTSDQPKPGDMATVFIKENGEVYFGAKLVEKLTDLPNMIEDQIEEKQQENKVKVLLNADKNVQYGKVVEVMNVVKDANIEFIGLVTNKVAR